MDVLFRSIGENMVDLHSIYAAQDSLQASDASESALTIASHFFDPPFAESLGASRSGSRAATPMLVRTQNSILSFVKSPGRQVSKLVGNMPGAFPCDSIATSPKSVRLVSEAEETLRLKEQ